MYASLEGRKPKISMGQFHLALVILAVYLICPTLGRDDGVHIISGVPNILKVECDHNIGMHTLSNGQEFSWRFKPNFFRTTKFYCHFYWGQKQTRFAVFDGRISRYCKDPSWDCDYFWLATPTVFNVSTDNKATWHIINHWPN